MANGVMAQTENALRIWNTEFETGSSGNMRFAR
jgi:hypothetical protein